MVKYNPKLEFLSLGGVNVTHFGESVAEYTREGNAVEVQKGIQGDTVTMEKHDQIDRIKTTLNPFCPLWGQIENWYRNKTQIPVQFKDDNTGVSRSSATGYIETVTFPHDGQGGDITIVCEDVQ